MLRLLTGLGLGGAMPNAIAIDRRVQPERQARLRGRRHVLAAIPSAQGFGGIIAAWLHPGLWLGIGCSFSVAAWRSLLLAGPPSSRCPRSCVPQGEAKPKIPVGRLFSEGRAWITILLWIIFFANLMELFFLTSWLPTTIGAQGVAGSYAVIATAVVQFAGVAAAFAMGPLVDRYGPQRVSAGRLCHRVRVLHRRYRRWRVRPSRSPW